MIGKNGVSLLIGHNGVQDKTTLSSANETVAKGIYDATTLSTVEVELAEGNIKDGITLFGFAGTVVEGTDISDANAAVGDVKTGQTFYSVEEPRKTGTMDTVAITDVNDDYPAGYHAGNVGGLVAIDAQLVTGSIKSGVTIFGVVGHTNVRDVSDADALVGEVKTGSTFYAVGGPIKTGTGTKTLSDANEDVAAGYYAATTLSAVDEHLAAGNIKDGITIFGFLGTFVSTLAEDVEGDAETAIVAEDAGGYYERHYVNALVTETLATKTLTYDANSITFAVAHAAAMSPGWGGTPKLYMRLFMGGVQMQSTLMPAADHENFVLRDFKAMSGELECSLRVYNSDDTNNVFLYGYTDAAGDELPYIVACGSVKIA